MSASQEELTVRLGLNTEEFERRLRESDRIAKQYANRAGAALNLGPMNGGMPAGWSSMANLSQHSQESIRGSSGLGGLLESAAKLHPALGEVMEKFGGLATKFAGFGAIVTPVVAGFGILRSSMKEVWELARQGEVLQTSSMFVLQLGKAARSVGEDAQDAAGKILRFETLIGNAQNGAKDATEALQKLGIKPWGKTMEEAILEAAEAFKKIEDPAERAKLANEAFGRGGLKTVEVMEKLADKVKQAKYGMLEQTDLDILDAGEKKWLKFWSSLKGGATDYMKVMAASWLRWSGFVKNAPGPVEERIGNPEEPPEAAKQRQEEAVKAERELAQARKEYEKAVEDSGTKEQQMAHHMGMAWKLEYELRETARGTTEWYRKQKELLEEQQKYKQLQKELDEEKERKAKKLEEYERRMNDLLKERYQADRAAAEAKADRSGWTVQDIFNQPMQYDRRGRPLIPEELLQAASRFLGRPIVGNEYGQMAQMFENNWYAARNAKWSGDAAKAFRLLMPGMAETATDAELNWRRFNDALTTSESDPMRSHLERLEDINDRIGSLVQAAYKDGVLIKPQMGK